MRVEIFSDAGVVGEDLFHPCEKAFGFQEMVDFSLDCLDDRLSEFLIDTVVASVPNTIVAQMI